MKNQKGFPLIELLIIIIIIGSLTLYVWNGKKLASCDFEADWRCEIIHGAGVIVPPAALITVWFHDDNDK
jgi:cytochrome c biogenesis factor